MWIIVGFMGKWHRVYTAEASAVHNDASAFGTYLCHLIACWMVLDKAVGTYSI